MDEQKNDPNLESSIEPSADPPGLTRRELGKMILGAGLITSVPVLWPKQWETPLLRVSRASAESCLSTPFVLDRQVDVVSSTEVTARWRKPFQPGCTRAMAKMEIQYSTNRFAEYANRTRVSVMELDLACPITGLTPNTTYFFWFKNLAKEGNDYGTVAPVAATTYAFSTPTNFAITQNGNPGISTVGWSAPSGSPGYELTVNYRTGTAGSIEDTTQSQRVTVYVAPGTTSYTITPRASRYVNEVKIRARLGAKTSSWTSVSRN